MTATVGANFGMNYAWASGEDGWNVGMDANLLKIDTLAKLKVINYTTTTPPESPSEGDVYIVGVGATGAWSGLDKNVVVRTGTSWTSYTPVNGWFAYDENSSSYIGYNGTSWIVDPLGDRAYALSIADPAVDTATIIQRITHFHNTDTAAALYPYAIFGGTVALANQSTISSISGYKSAVNGVVCQTGGTTGLIATAIVYGRYSTSGGGKYDSIYSSGDTLQAVFYTSLMGHLPDASNNFEFRCGMFYNAYLYSTGVDGFGACALDPFSNFDITSTRDRAAAYFYVDKNSGYWKCASGTGGINTPQTTTTTVTAYLNQMTALHIKIATDGSVSFWIDGVLVATHTTGKISDGSILTEACSTVHLAAVSTYPNGWFVSSIGVRQTLATPRTNFIFR